MRMCLSWLIAIALGSAVAGFRPSVGRSGHALAQRQAPVAPAAAPDTSPGQSDRALKGSFYAISNTAMGVTGDLVLSETTLSFQRDRTYETRIVGRVAATEEYAKGAGSWAALSGSSEAAQVELRSVVRAMVRPKARQPSPPAGRKQGGRENQGLCASAATTYVALISGMSSRGEPALVIAAFKSERPPGPDGDAADLCGTFGYAPAAPTRPAAPR